MVPQRFRFGFMGPSAIRICKFAVNTYDYMYDLASDILSWLYLFTFFLCFYSLKLFFQNMFLCYLILLLFIVTCVILFYSNLQKINEQGFSSLLDLRDPRDRPQKVSGASSTRKPHVSAIIENKVSISRFAFTDMENWQKELSALKSDLFFSSNNYMKNSSSSQNFDSLNDDKNCIYPESTDISSRLDLLIDVLLDSFVKNWYTRIHDLSSSPRNSDLFTDELKVVFQHIIKQLFKEFSSVDLANLIILTILPILTNHFNSYVIAKNITQSKNDCMSNISTSVQNGSNNNGNKNLTNNTKKKKNSESDSTNRNKNENDNFSQNWNLLISKNYKHHGKLHPVINKFRDNEEFVALNCKNHLRNKLNKLLPVLLYSDRKLSNCLPVVFLLREILINYVLFPALKKISDPDFYNKQVVDRIGNSISDRNKVNQLRAELQKHSKTLKHKKSMIDNETGKNDITHAKNIDENKIDINKDAIKNSKKESSNKKKSTAKKTVSNHSSNELLEFKLILSTGQQSFESFLKKVQSNQSLVDLRQLKFYVNLQLQRTFRNEEYQKLEKLFENSYKDAPNIDHNSGESLSNMKKLKDLYSNYKTLIKRLQTIQSIINDKIQQSNVHLTNDDTDSIHSKQSSNYNHHNISRLSMTTSLSLSSLLNDPLLLSYYMEYMELQHKLIIVQFWLNVNGIKDPLENLLMIDSNDIYNDDISVNSTETRNSNNKSSNADENDAELKITDNNFFHDFIASSNDIRTIFNTYFHNSLIVTKNKVIYSNVSNFVKTYEKYFCQSPPIEKVKQSVFDDLENKLSKARKSILVLQAEIFQVMEHDLPNFYKSNTYLKLLANENWNPLNHGTIMGKEKDQVSITSFLSDQDSNSNQNQEPFKFHSAAKMDGSDFSERVNEIDERALPSANKNDYLENTKEKAIIMSHDPNDIKGKKRLGVVSPNDKDTFFGNNDDLIVSKDVIDAVENVLTKIIESSNNSSSNIDKNLNDDSKPKKIDAKLLKNSLFGISDEKDSSELLLAHDNETDKINGDSLLNEKLTTNISEETDAVLLLDWEDEEAELDSMLYDMISAESDPRSDNANIAAAATLALQNDKKKNSRHEGIIVKPPPLFDINFTNPGTSLKDLQLNLSGEILRLGNEIDDLNNQTEILKPLIQKAELTNNTAELRILNKASSSLLRELNLKSLQRQQYIVQENENNLFGKATVNITGYMTKVDESTNKEYTSYIIEVRKATSASTSDTTSSILVKRDNSEKNVKSDGKDSHSDNHETLKLINTEAANVDRDGYGFYSTWVVSRRFSLFYMLHQYLKSLYPNVKDLYFPSKKLNISLLQSTSKKFQEQQTNLIETRKKYLCEYLKNLLVMPEICDDSIFRLFLSSQRFNIDIFSRLIKISKNKKMKYIEMEQAASSTNKKNNNFSTGNSFEDVTAKLYNGLASGLFFMGDNSFVGNSASSFSNLNEDGKKIPEAANEKLNDAFEMQNELNSYDYGLKPFTTTTSSGKMTTSSKVSGSTLAVNMGQISSSGIFSSHTRNLRQRNGNLFSNYQNYNRGVISKNNKDNTVENNIRPMILSKSIPFVKPICDLILSIFKLNNRANSWLRGRAILVLLQRLFGSTIEKKIREFFGELSLKNNESKVVELLDNIKAQFFPNGKFQSSSNERSKEEIQNEKQKNRREAKELLEIFITDISSKIVGIKSSKFASLEIHNLFQNEILNTHLVYTVFDEILDLVFSELLETDGEQEVLSFN